MWPLTHDSPKALLPLAGVPFVEYQLRQLAGVGVEEVVLAVGRHLLERWEEYVAVPRAGIDLRLAVEDTPLDTAGPVRAVLDSLEDRFLVLNGDVVVEADLGRVADAAGPATLGLVEVEDTSAYGVVVTDDSGRVQRFVEKPPPSEAPARTVNAGMYALERSVFERYPVGPLSFERTVFPDLASAGLLGAVILEGQWIDIGTPDLYLAAHDAVHAGATALHRPERAHDHPAGRGAWSFVGDGARVASTAVVEEAVILSGAEIAAGAVVHRAVIGTAAVVGEEAIVTGAAMVGPGAVVGSGCELDRGVRIAPATVLAPGSVSFSPPK